MSRILKVLIVLMMIVGIAAPAVMAEDRLSLSGSMQVRGFYLDDDDITGSTSDDGRWNDQRLRTEAKLSVAEGVSVNFRFDVTESQENSSDATAWGATGQNTQRRADIQFDKAYIQLEKGEYTMTAGQQYTGYGTGMIADHVGTGFTVTRGPLTLAHYKFQEGAGSGDTSLTTAKYSFKNDAMTADVFAGYEPMANSDAEQMGFGVALSTNLDAVALKGELNVFSGEDAAGGDQEGMELYLDASAGVSENVVLGGMFLYAADSDDTQITRLGGTGFGGWSPQTYGYNTTDFSVDVDVFDPAGASAGVMALSVYTDVKVNEDLGLMGSVMFLQAADDDKADGDMMSLNASAKYELMANTAVTASLNVMDGDLGGADATVTQAITGLYVNF
ncbi:MAG: hypothetical protein C0618_03425 [Desulfuromonas sp.]|nr:MAG: hypothetical protein C0618_03425 [Desulfuromonas sp.]